MNLIDNARAVEAALQRLQGPPATGKLLVKTLVTEGVPGPDTTLDPGSIAFPVPEGALDRSGPVFVKRNPATTDADGNGGAWTVTAAGTLVDVESVQGGVHVNQPGGTPYRWDPPLDGVELVSVAEAAGIAGGAFSGAFAGLRQFSHLKSVNFDPGVDLFRSVTFDYPAALLAWGGIQPLDGTYAARPGPRTARVSSGGRTLYSMAWLLFLVTSRLDGAEARSNEGLTLLSDVLEVINDCRRVRGRVFFVSTEPGAQVMSAKPYQVTPSTYVDLMTFECTFELKHRPEEKTYHDWLRTRLRQQTPPLGPEPPIDLPNMIIPMPPNGPGTPPFP